MKNRRGRAGPGGAGDRTGRLAQAPGRSPAEGRYPGGKELPDPLCVQNRGGLQDRIMHYTYPIDDLIHLTKVDTLWDTVRYVF
jgi:hypothetical protein